MIEATEILAKVGKRKFREMALQSQRNSPTMLTVERRRRWGRAKHRKCHHGVWVIENYEPMPCLDCGVRVKSRSMPRDSNFTGLNMGLGVYTDGYSDFKRALKSKKAIWIGDDKL